MKKPKEIDWTWSPLPPASYAQTISEFVHFSFKTTNSNATSGGIRVGPDKGLDLPYVSARTLIQAGYVIPLDYAANGGKTALIAKQVNAFEAGKAAPGRPDEARAIQDAMRDARTTGGEVNADFVSLRLRQLLLPRDGAYVAVTPLGASGLCQIIKNRIDSHNEVARETGRHRLTRAFLGIGGANPQNVGALVRDMQQPLVSFPPQARGDLREVFGTYYRGISLRPSRSKMLDYRQWQMAARHANNGHLPTGMTWRAEEQAKIVAIVSELQDRARHARARLEQYRGYLPNAGDPLLSPALRNEVQGLIAPELRDGNWRNATAAAIAREIADYAFDDQAGDFLFEQKNIDTFARWIAEVLQ